MTQFPLESLAGRLARLMGETSQRRSRLHDRFLQQRETSLRQVQQLIELQIGAPSRPAARPALFDSAQLDEFGAGLVSGCFGPEFARYDARPIPRIPNGDLKMMSRVVAIEGARRSLRQPASIEVEYAVPLDAWFHRDGGSFELPYALLMEIALQPCGFLSAYLDSYALLPGERFFFRNLDGSARVTGSLTDARGKTLTTQARLLSSTASVGTVIQKFSFTVGCAGQALYVGESTFGYFSENTMASQVGLDGGQLSAPWFGQDPGIPVQAVELSRWRGNASPRLAGGRLGLVDRVSFLPGGGETGQGYAYARRMVDPGDWFFPFHFYGDPVMPGSLGVEAVMDALKAGALALGLAEGLRAPRFCLPAGAPPTTWRYRGQVTPQHKQMELEVHLGKPNRAEDGVSLAGDASVWVDGLRIYEIKNAVVRLVKGNR